LNAGDDTKWVVYNKLDYDDKELKILTDFFDNVTEHITNISTLTAKRLHLRRSRNSRTDPALSDTEHSSDFSTSPQHWTNAEGRDSVDCNDVIIFHGSLHSLSVSDLRMCRRPRSSTNGREAANVVFNFIILKTLKALFKRVCVVVHADIRTIYLLLNNKLFIKI
jgi:hypothetical protein